MSATGAGEITGLVLAGGRARRMGGEDKGLIPLAGRALVEHVLDALRPQVSELLINANRNQARYAGFGAAVVADTHDGFLGPLAGMAAGLAAAATPLLVCVPCDSPCLPPDLVARLAGRLHAADADLAVAHDGERLQPVFVLLRVSLRARLEQYLASGERKIDRWYAGLACEQVDFSDAPEAFRNVNTPEERDALEALLRGGGA